VLLGAGEACTGIAQLLEAAMREAGVPPDRVRASRFLFDSRGLLRVESGIDDPHKRAVAAPREALSRYGLDGTADPTPEDVIRAVKPTILIGATATPGTFSRAMIEEMARHVERPIVMPLSNPTSRAECSAHEAIAWSGGRALVATGSPFADVLHEEVRHVIGQANNVFVFPGVGMGAIVAELREVDDATFLVAARALAGCVSEERLSRGALLPEVADLRRVCSHVATAVIRHASERGLGRSFPDDEAIARAVADASWFPDYASIEPA
jgi:malic enzyme